MKKFIPIILVCSLVLSGLGAVAFSTNVSIKQITNITSESASILFSSQPMLSEKDGFFEIQIDGASTYLLESDRPVLPIYVKTFQIPFGSTDIQVICTSQNIDSMTLSKEIIPARISPLSKANERTGYMRDSTVYGSAAFYPSNWYKYDLGAGRNENDIQVTFVKVVCYPVRYSPLNNQIEYAGGFDITVTYDEPTTPLKTYADPYEMVVIAPKKFKSALQSLIDHKNTSGVATRFKSVESILEEYTGFDQPEQIKKFIYHEYNNSNITYVMLVGGLKSHIYAKDKDTASAGWKAWWIPVRYVNIPEEDDEGCLSDLYYGCLYNETGEFDSWDSNGDGLYAAWGVSGVETDDFDMYPEVYVSRIPAVTVGEVRAVVKKIITYESTGPTEKSWFNTFVGVGGQTSGFVSGYPDGQYLCDLAYNYTKKAFPDMQLKACYASNRDIGGRTPIPRYILKSINEGAGFVDFEGHGNPYSWNTIWHDGEYPEDWTGGINIFEFPLLFNGNKLPVVVVGGCHNALYNVSMIPAFLNMNRNVQDYFCYGLPVPVCFCAGLVLKNRGGAIASMGCTGYGWGEGNNPVSLSGELEMNFFWQISENNVTNLAKAHSQAISKYYIENSIEQLDAFCITNWALIGDPSLVFGGYSS